LSHAFEEKSKQDLIIRQLRMKIISTFSQRWLRRQVWSAHV